MIVVIEARSCTVENVLIKMEDLVSGLVGWDLKQYKMASHLEQNNPRD